MTFESKCPKHIGVGHYTPPPLIGPLDHSLRFSEILRDFPRFSEIFPDAPRDFPRFSEIFREFQRFCKILRVVENLGKFQGAV